MGCLVPGLSQPAKPSPVPFASAAPCLPSHQFPFQMVLRLWFISLRAAPGPVWGRDTLPGRGRFIPNGSRRCLVTCPVWERDAPTRHWAGEGHQPRIWHDGGKKGKENSPESAGGSGRGGNDMALTVVTVAVSWSRRSLANPQEGMRGLQKGNEDTDVDSATSPGGRLRGAEHRGTARRPHNSA